MGSSVEFINQPCRVYPIKLIAKFRFIGELIVAKPNIPLLRGNVSEADKGVVSAK